MTNVAIIGVGMHPWGRWNKDFVQYGVIAARKAMDDAAISWRAIGFLSSAATIRNGYAGYISGATFAQALGWQGAELSTSYAGCASGAHAIGAARSKILAGDCELALVVAADTASAGPLRPAAGSHDDDPDWIRYRLGLSIPTYLGLLARRRMVLYGANQTDFSLVRAKNSRSGLCNPLARYRRELTSEEVTKSAMVADPLRLLHISSLSDGAAAIVMSSEAFARRHSNKAIRLVAVSTNSARYPGAGIEMPYVASDSCATLTPTPYLKSVADATYERASIGPEDLSLAEVYDLSSAMELDWYEHLGLCAYGEAESLLRSGATALGGQIPVNTSGGLASLGEAMSAQAVAQVCELCWQLRGNAGSRQIQGAVVGMAVSHGIYGHAAGIIVKR